MSLSQRESRDEEAYHKIRLFSYVMSPYAARVHMVLAFKQIDFLVHYVNPMHLRRELPVGYQVPVLSLGCEHLAGSDTIIARLEQDFPHPALLPEDKAKASRHLAFLDWIDASLVPVLFSSVLLRMDRHMIRQLRRGWHLGAVMHRSAVGGLPELVRMGWPLILARQGFVRDLAGQAGQTPKERRKTAAGIPARFEHALENGPFLFSSADPGLGDLMLFASIAAPVQTAILPNPLGPSDKVTRWMQAMADRASPSPPLVPDQCRQLNPF